MPSREAGHRGHLCQTFNIESVPGRGGADLFGEGRVRVGSGTVKVHDALSSGRDGLQIFLHTVMVTEAGFRVVAGEIHPIGRFFIAVELGDAAMSEARDAAVAALAFNAAWTLASLAPARQAGDRRCAHCRHTIRCPSLLEGAGHASWRRCT
jgi:hypothetical protein